jgi:hydrogenase maturation protease
MPPPNDRAVLVLGLGNVYRGDDGVGCHIARELMDEALAADVREASGEGAALMDAWRSFEHVFLVDAVHSGGAPGTIHRLDAHAAPIPSQFFHYSTHAFSVAEAVEMARALDELPPRLIIYGIEGGTYESGAPLSPAVAEAAGVVAARLREEIQTLTTPSHA